jgi:hypothetical protein
MCVADFASQSSPAFRPWRRLRIDGCVSNDLDDAQWERLRPLQSVQGGTFHHTQALDVPAAFADPP